MRQFLRSLQDEPSKDAEDESPPVRPAPTSTIQYIPISEGIRALHIIPPSPRSSSTASYSYDRGTTTIHYPATSVLIQSVPPLVVATSPPSAGPSPHDKNLLQLVSTTSTVTTVQTATKSFSKQHTQTSTGPSIQTQTVQFIQTVKTVNNNNENSSPLSDQHIRVLTPSEIMRTLPSIGQETYDTPPSTVSPFARLSFYF